MSISLGNQEINKLIVVGDRVLIKPKSAKERTSSGLFLPPGIQEKEKLQSGYVMKVGPGYPIPSLIENDEVWKDKSENVKYIPLQPKQGDLAVYVQNNCHEIEFNKERYILVPHAAILLLVRDDELFK